MIEEACEITGRNHVKMGSPFCKKKREGNRILIPVKNEEIGFNLKQREIEIEIEGRERGRKSDFMS